MDAIAASKAKAAKGFMKATEASGSRREAALAGVRPLAATLTNTAKGGAKGAGAKPPAPPAALKRGRENEDLSNTKPVGTPPQRACAACAVPPPPVR